MTASKRAAKELENLQNALPRYLWKLSSDDNNVLVWHAVLLPNGEWCSTCRDIKWTALALHPGTATVTLDKKGRPYNLRAFNLLISFPEQYPFMPPTLKFTTKIYHPNVESSGRVCLPIISKENWQPYTKTYQVLEALNMLVNRPELDQPVRVDLADLLAQDPELFYRRAEEFTLKFGENRPS